MKKIYWQSRTPVLFKAVQSGHLPAGANGGNAYDFHAAMALKEDFDLQMDEAAVMKKSDSFRSYWWRMAHHSIHTDILICEPSPIVFGRRNKKAKTVAMIHHIDDDLANSSLKHKWFFDRLKKRLSGNVDMVITVSRHWEEYLKELGCKRIKIIYNSFDLHDYDVSDEEVDAFISKFNFKRDAPIIYIGNAHRQKGVYEAYAALKDKNYQLVMSGSVNHAKDLPVKFLSLERREYLTLLKASHLVITLSKMTEGWNRVAHEALLSKTPVIGSGTGGMRELLEGAWQVIVSDPKNLAAEVERTLKNREHFSVQGYQYVKKYDNHYFVSEWKKVIRELIAE